MTKKFRIYYYLERYARQGKSMFRWVSDDFLESGIIQAETRDQAKKKLRKTVDKTALFFR